MHTLTNAPIQLKITGAVLAIAALAIALAWVAITAGPTMAQSNPYDDPKPCGPDQVPGNPDETITSGHYAVFDAYWDFDKETLNNNLCPPSVVHTIETQTDPVTYLDTKVEVSTRTASNVDIQRTVFHLDSTFEHTLTATDVENYDFFKLGDSDDSDSVDDAVDQTVWWIRTGDDAMTTDVTETESALQMGFSAGLFDSKYWYLADESGTEVEPLQYEFEAIREPGIPPEEYGHFFAFDDSPPSDALNKTAEWDSSDADTNALPLYPGEYQHFQWAFTKPGTYVISVQLKGHVRQTNPHEATHQDYDENWKPISGDSTVTSEVKRYTFHVGALTLNDEPAFQVERSVEEHSADDTLVGAPVGVYQGDPEKEEPDTLTYSLSGEGHTLFSVEADADGNAQIKVGGDLDHEVRSEYRLTLGVSDGKNHEDRPDSSVDHTISVGITLTDQPEAERSVGENPAGDTNVGDAIVVAGASASTVYTLAGDGNDLFTVERDANNDAQIKVAADAVLNYEDASSYILTLNASDGVNAQDVRVTINVVDDPDEQLAITLTADPSGSPQIFGTDVEFTGIVRNSPVATGELLYGWGEHDQGGGHALSADIHSLSRTVTFTSQQAADRNPPVKTVTREYHMRVWYSGVTAVESNQIVITWQASQ